MAYIHKPLRPEAYPNWGAATPVVSDYDQRIDPLVETARYWPVGPRLDPGLVAQAWVRRPWLRRFTACALLLLAAGPAWAGPQWIPVNERETTFVNYNSVRGAGPFRLIDVSADVGSTSVRTSVWIIDCANWRIAVQYPDGSSVPPEPIGLGSAGDLAGRLICRNSGYN